MEKKYIWRQYENEAVLRFFFFFSLLYLKNKDKNEFYINLFSLKQFEIREVIFQCSFLLSDRQFH